MTKKKEMCEVKWQIWSVSENRQCVVSRYNALSGITCNAISAWGIKLALFHSISGFLSPSASGNKRPRSIPVLPPISDSGRDLSSWGTFPAYFLLVLKSTYREKFHNPNKPNDARSLNSDANYMTYEWYSVIREYRQKKQCHVQSREQQWGNRWSGHAGPEPRQTGGCTG